MSNQNWKHDVLILDFSLTWWWNWMCGHKYPSKLEIFYFWEVRMAFHSPVADFLTEISTSTPWSLCPPCNWILALVWGLLLQLVIGCRIICARRMCNYFGKKMLPPLKNDTSLVWHYTINSARRRRSLWKWHKCKFSEHREGWNAFL